MLRLFQNRRVVQAFAVLLIVLGGFFGLYYTQNSIASYQEIQFAVEHNFDAGNLDVALIEDWMTIRYIAEAYAVPQVFIFDELNIPMKPFTSRLPLEKLNSHERLGEVDGEPALVSMVREAISKYRANPVVTGLAERKVEHWMNMQYIANSTGIPVETLFAEVGIPVEGHDYMPLGWMVEQTGYEPGLDHLLETLQRLVDEVEGDLR